MLLVALRIMESCQGLHISDFFLSDANRRSRLLIEILVKGMEEEHKLELITIAIRKLLEEERNKESSNRSAGEGDENDDRSFLCNLLSQIDSLKVETGSEEVVSALVDTLKARSENAIKQNTVDVYYREDIVKELKKVKRQNFFTHCLLSVLIVLTVVWQLSEVSIILSVKERISHPFKSLGGMISGVLKRPKTIIENAEKNSSKQKHDEDSVLPPIKIPELAHVNLP